MLIVFFLGSLPPSDDSLGCANSSWTCAANGDVIVAGRRCNPLLYKRAAVWHPPPSPPPAAEALPMPLFPFARRPPPIDDDESTDNDEDDEGALRYMAGSDTSLAGWHATMSGSGSVTRSAPPAAELGERALAVVAAPSRFIHDSFHRPHLLINVVQRASSSSALSG